ncbi:TetR/AcrR family transcriptional regulator [Sporosarcina oncorhynchi]|uniref:TetR/AcrR family transcriptional regulator n=1 Tax=Sporosarcina oncorhynchi TaxID=3056444 RepID=A0ABZ0L4R7_9BACL|nr:TetR/AcrR family transcriptional regulator [Sporosarcina sp. T2O-4]WOV86923.1 TetR/AcrR family transcriptional regulator [Sporosarcina sp. T2O-4]
MKPMDRYELELKKNRENRIVTVLDAAEVLFAKKGIEKTTMQEIADAANLGVATIFRLFPKKEQIAVGIATRRLEKFLELFQNIHSMEITSIEKIEALMDHFLEEFAEGNDFKMIEDFEIYSMLLSEPIEDTEQYKVIYREISHIYAEIIKTAMKDGSIRTDIDIEQSLITLINAFVTFAKKLSIQKNIGFIQLDVAPEKQLILLKKVILDYLMSGMK